MQGFGQKGDCLLPPVPPKKPHLQSAATTMTALSHPMTKRQSLAARRAVTSLQGAMGTAQRSGLRVNPPTWKERKKTRAASHRN